MTKSKRKSGRGVAGRLGPPGLQSLGALPMWL